jgi:metal-responsive CopG/Arc/MetJ family transcriptional regulator
MTENNSDIEIAETLLERLERISVDSHWSHRANGIRKSLLAILEQNETKTTLSKADLDKAINAGYKILNHAAKEFGARRFQDFGE